MSAEVGLEIGAFCWVVRVCVCFAAAPIQTGEAN